MATSQNGYPANDVTLTSVRTIPGTDRKIRLRNGPAGDLLLWVLSQFDRRVEDLDGGELDDWGYAERPIRGSTTVLSNHASGTAADANATRHPQGTSPSANFTPAQIAVIRAIVAATEGCVRWGGDYTAPAPKDGMHFEIIASESRCAAVLAKLTAHQEEDDDMPSATEIADAVWNKALQNALDPGWSSASDIVRFGHFEAGKGRREIKAMLETLLAKAGGATADEVAAKLLPALTSSMAAMVADLDVSQLDKISDEDAHQIAQAVTDRAAGLLGGAA